MLGVLLGVLTALFPALFGALPDEADDLPPDADLGVLGASLVALFDGVFAGVLGDLISVLVGEAVRLLGDAKRSDLDAFLRDEVEDRPPVPRKEVRMYGGMKDAMPAHLYQSGCSTTCRFIHCAAVKSELTPSASTVGCDGDSFVRTQLPSTEPTTAPTSTSAAR